MSRLFISPHCGPAAHVAKDSEVALNELLRERVGARDVGAVLNGMAFSDHPLKEISP